jgi:hypothetical protein
VVEAEGEGFETRDELAKALRRGGSLIPYASGRSYGDSALAKRVVLTRRFDKFLRFDEKAGLLRVESGVTLAEIIDLFLPRGWFLSVTPGTRFITVGGAIASDVHGKNHHKVGCFTRFVRQIDLMLPSGEVRRCSRTQNQELFRATCGGMGLTGVILTADLLLKPVSSACIRETDIRCRNLEEIFYQFEANAGKTYSVAWIDCLATGENIGRSVLMLGEHADSGGLSNRFGRPLPMPIDFPAFVLNRYSVNLFNRMYFRTRPIRGDKRLVPLEPFFYPLDRIAQYGRMYGRRGFTQYQCALPKHCSYDGLKMILKRIAAAGVGSFLGVLKLLGPENENYLSFPLEGYTLAIEIKIEPRLFPLLDTLDRIVLSCGGRIYLSKDVRMHRETFRSGYPRWQAFDAVRQSHDLKEKFQSYQAQRLGI